MKEIVPKKTVQDNELQSIVRGRTTAAFHVARCAFLAMVLWPALMRAQVNTGSNGSDGALNPTGNTVINMASHPDGIYQYTSVNIPANVIVTFTPNVKNTPVVWLVQGNCSISGTVDISGQDAPGSVQPGFGGPGGGRGGNGGPQATSGAGPSGGSVGTLNNIGGNASYSYANAFLVPLLGGSGGGGSLGYGAGGGGSGSILIAVANSLTLNGSIQAHGGWGHAISNSGARGSGAGVRLIASRIAGNGAINADLVRFDTYEDDFFGGVPSNFSQGFQPVIMPIPAQSTQLAIVSVAGVPVGTQPTGVLSTPDAIISGQQANPVGVVVQCSNLPLNTPITVSVRPTTGLPVSAVGYNTTGTPAASTVTVSLNIPRGGGLIYATAATAP
jgi:hypothetical protein